MYSYATSTLESALTTALFAYFSHPFLTLFSHFSRTLLTLFARVYPAHYESWGSLQLQRHKRDYDGAEEHYRYSEMMRVVQEQCMSSV
jgi:hypothetical protein